MQANLMPPSDHLAINFRQIRLWIPQPIADGKKRHQHILLGQNIHDLLRKPRLPVVDPERERIRPRAP